MSDFMAAKNISLSLSGLRIGPLDPTTKAPKTNHYCAFQTEDINAAKVPKFFSNNRSGFSGGFKIPEEMRKAKMGRKKIKKTDGSDSDRVEESNNKIDLTKDEIMQNLNLGASQTAGGSGKHGAGSKSALTKDLIENLEKELEKLKRTEENIKVRKHIALKGDRSILDETEEDRQKAKNKAIEDEMKASGNNVIHADQKRIQVLRHRVGQLDSVKSVPYEEIQAMRAETEARLKILEEQYWGKKENAEVGGRIREKYKQFGAQNNQEEEQKIQKISQTPQSLAMPKKNLQEAAGILKNPLNKEYQESNQVQTPQPQSLAMPRKIQSAIKPIAQEENKPLFSYKNLKSKKSSGANINQEYDPRQQIYEAKFEKFLANKQTKQETDKKRQSLKKEDFDIYTKDVRSPSKKSQRFRESLDPSQTRLSGKYNSEDILPIENDKKIQMDQKKQSLRGEDPFQNLGVGSQDKMSFFLLKWVFNAIKRDSSDDDPKFQGKPFIQKSDLIKQLQKNPELMQALGYRDERQLSENVKLSNCKKEGFLMWSEFLDFFFLKDVKVQDQHNETQWWNKLDNVGHLIKKKVENEDLEDEQQNVQKEALNISDSNNQSGVNYKTDKEKKQVKMTPSLMLLKESREERAKREVEEEFEKIEQEKKVRSGTTIEKKKPKKVVEYQTIEMEIEEEQFGFGREKSKNLMLQSQFEIMREVFERCDKYNEGILRRSDFVMALRTDTRVIDFIDCEAVKKAYSSTVLTLDVIFLEIEKDEQYDQVNKVKDQLSINHKEFITWNEFLTYFNDYQDIEVRNKKSSQVQGLEAAKSSKNNKNADQNNENENQIVSLIEQEKERRLQELPKLRPADQIDISEKQLQLIKDIFDSIPRSVGMGKDQVNVLTFFVTIRKDPQIRAINSAIARDPEGYSRIPRETFQDVFDRMERDLQQKQVDWSTIVEFFTKRGRPLSKDEIQKAIEEDRREKEIELYKIRQEEDADRRRNQRLVGDIEEEEDFEAFELRKKAEQAVENNFQKKSSPQQQYNENQGNDYDSEDDMQREGNEIDSQDENHRTNHTTLQSDHGFSNMKLTQQDYVGRALSEKSKKKGKYGVTVPQPFGFDMRDKTKPKSIREKKIEEMIQQKRLVERAIIKHQFRSKPIPTEVLIPRFQNLMEADLARRQMVKSQSLVLTKQREAPFSFWERDKHKQQQKLEEQKHIDSPQKQKNLFKANPIPRACSVLIYDIKFKEDELKRGERIRKNAEIAYAKAKMPPTMQKYADRKKQEAPKKLEIEYTFRPEIGPQITGKMLQEKAERFQRDLAKKKGQKTQTQPRSPKFVKRESKLLDRPFVNEGENQKQESQYNLMIKKLAQNAMKQENQTNPLSTKTVALAQAKRRQEIQEKKKQEESIKRENEDRYLQQNTLKGTVQNALKSKFGKSSSTIIAEKAAEKKQDQRKENRKAQKLIQEAITKGRSRPMLFDLSQGDYKANSNLAYIKATEKMIKLLKESGENPNHYLNDKQKELMEEHNLKNQLKQKYSSGQK